MTKRISRNVKPFFFSKAILRSKRRFPCKFNTITSLPRGIKPEMLLKCSHRHLLRVCPTHWFHDVTENTIPSKLVFFVVAFHPWITLETVWGMPECISTWRWMWLSADCNEVVSATSSTVLTSTWYLSKKIFAQLRPIVHQIRLQIDL